MDQKVILEMLDRLATLKRRAKNAGYKNQIPKLPTFKKECPWVHDSQMLGFKKRLANWEAGLERIENPNGPPQPVNTKNNRVTMISEGVYLLGESYIDVANLS